MRDGDDGRAAQGRSALAGDEFPSGPAEFAEAVLAARLEAARHGHPVEGFLDFRALFDRSPVGMAVVDSLGHVAVANVALGDFLGRSPHALTGRALHDLAADDDVGRFRRPGPGRCWCASTTRRAGATPSGCWCTRRCTTA